MTASIARAVAAGRPSLALHGVAEFYSQSYQATFAFTERPTPETIQRRFTRAGANVLRIEVDGAQTEIVVWYRVGEERT